MALKLSLKPGERAAINGAVVVNSDRRASLVIENKARVLRERDIIQPQDANTPAKRIYMPIMMMYLDPETIEDMQPEYEKRLMEFAGVVSSQEALNACASINACMANGDYYKALSACRTLIDFEKSRLPDVA